MKTIKKPTKKVTRGLGWTTEEDDFLRTIYPNSFYFIDEIQKVIPWRTETAIRNRLSRTNIYRDWELPFEYTDDSLTPYKET